MLEGLLGYLIMTLFLVTLSGEPETLDALKEDLPET
jgi:hypothetical protein